MGIAQATDRCLSYYTSYSQKLDGTVDGSTLNLDVANSIEGNWQNSLETWKVKSDELLTDNKRLLFQNCAEVNKAWQSEAVMPAAGTAGANNVKTKQVKFGAGQSDTTVSGALIRGDCDIYQLNARSGQIMALSISSLEDNAVFDLIDPNGTVLEDVLKVILAPLDY